MPTDRRAGLLLCDDLIFTSRIAGVARAAGLSLHVAKSPAEFQRLSETHQPAWTIVDLCHPGLALDELLAGLRSVTPEMPRVVGYGSHVEVEVLKAARAAGCDPVLPRSKFVEDLPTLLPLWAGAAAGID